MKKELQEFISNELIVVRIANGKVLATVGILEKLSKKSMVLKIEQNMKSLKKKDLFSEEIIPYSSVLKVSTGQKVLSR